MLNVKNIEINEKFAEAFDIMENTRRNIFVTGRAGTGKSTLLELFRSRTKRKIAVLAPTGVAALNVRGQTIHSFFGWKPDISLLKVKKAKPGDERASMYKKLDAIVIDEVSMVRADLMDCVDKFMRLNGKEKLLPFGGAQMIFIGDLYQLPPVVLKNDKLAFSHHYETPYFFSAKIFAKSRFEMDMVELEKIYRQKDNVFISLLNSIRNKTISPEEIDAFNNRCQPDFEPKISELYIHLVGTNRQASAVNNKMLDTLPGKAVKSTGYTQGDFEPSVLPTDMDLYFKPKAQIMLLNNDALGRWVNGSMARVIEIKEDEDGKMAVAVKFSNGETHFIYRHTWDMLNYHYNHETKQLESEKAGSFTQYPFKLAWAITIHKSQGKTFDKVIIDIGRGSFAHGQMYVAVSRATSLEGLVLKKPLSKNQIWMDWKVVDFITKYQYRRAEMENPLENKKKIIKAAIKEKKKIEITYLKASDIKSKRKIIPKKIGEFEYLGKTFEGVKAYCCEREEERMFRIDRILEIKE